MTAARVARGLLPGMLVLALAGARSADALPVLNPSNGHYYDVVNAQVNWETARLQASSLVYAGAAGHLVTVTSAAENLFLTSTYGSTALHYHWMGGFQPAGSPEPDGGWSWVTGEAFVYRNGAFANNLGGAEDRIVFDHGVVADGKQWNDLTGSWNTDGFVVEYEPSGACCRSGGTCVITPPEDCTGADVYQGNGAACTPDPCTPPGACCIGGSCVVVTVAGCLAQNGSYQGEGTTCPPSPACPPPEGACCLHDGSCQFLTEAACLVLSGSWTAFGSVCAPNPCEQPSGSCCYPDGTCIVMTQAPCAGGWTIDGVCLPNTCPGAPSGVDGGELDSVPGVRANPNPFAGSVSLRIAGPNAAAARVLIFDAAGRLVRTAWKGTPNGRAFPVTWDGRDDFGREAATGIYMVRLESGSGNAILRLIKVR